MSNRTVSEKHKIRTITSSLGATFYEHCARIVQEAALAEQRLTQTQSELAGLVKVTATPAFVIRHVLPALPDFYRQYPQIRVQLACSNQPLDLGEAGVDLGIRIAFKPAPNLVARKLAANRAVLCATPAYLKQHVSPRRLDDLRKHECVRALIDFLVERFGTTPPWEGGY